MEVVALSRAGFSTTSFGAKPSQWHPFLFSVHLTSRTPLDGTGEKGGRLPPPDTPPRTAAW